MTHTHSAVITGASSGIGTALAFELAARGYALDEGHDEVLTEVDGTTWVQDPFPYQRKCLAWVRDEYSKLSSSDRAAVDGLLEGTGCEALVN